MKLFVLFCQPEDKKFVPQALAVVDEYFALHKYGSVESAKAELEKMYMEAAYLLPDDNFDWFEVNLGAIERTIQNVLIPVPPVLTGDLEVPKPEAMRNPSITVQIGRIPGKVDDDEIPE